MPKKIRATLVGCGGMSRAWLSTARDLDGVEVVGLVDILKKNARQHVAEFALDNAVVGTDLEEVLAATQPDVVFDCTIPEAHTPVTTTALKHGCHVLGEKPLSNSMINARKSLRAAARAGKIYAVIQNRRYAPPIRRLARFLARGSIGQITTVDSDFYIGAHFGGFRDHMRHVLLLDMAIHTFDQARLLTGANPVSVYCREWNPAGSWYDHDASAIALFEMTDNIAYTYRGSWCAEGLNTSWQAQWRIIGTKGSLTWDGDEEIQIEKVGNRGGFISKTRAVKLPPLAKRDRIGGHAGLIREFIDCVRRGRVPETVCTDNIHSLAMVFGAIKSAQKNRPVQIKT